MEYRLQRMRNNLADAGILRSSMTLIWHLKNIWKLKLIAVTKTKSHCLDIQLLLL
jgi:hypothetical protein